MNPTVVISGFERAKRKLQQVKDRIEDTKKPLDRCGIYMIKTTGKRFMDEKGPTGKWARLKESTTNVKVTKKHTRGSSHILRDTSTLFGSMGRGRRRPRGPNGIWNLSKEELVFGTSMKHGQYHHKGTRYMAKRVFLYVTSKDKRQFLEIFKQYIREVYEKEGLKSGIR